MGDIDQLSLNSAKKCLDKIIDEDPAVTTSPLSELVWSQHKGLSLRYAASSLADDKAPVLWSTESFNIIISQPHCTDVGESSNTKGFISDALNSLQLKPNLVHYDTERASLLGSPRSTVGVQPVHSSRIHENCQDKKGKSVMYDKQDHDLSRKMINLCSPRTTSRIGDRFESGALTTDHTKSSMPDNYGPPHIGASSLDPIERIGEFRQYHQTSSSEEVSAYKETIREKYGSHIKAASSSRSAEGKQVDLPLSALSQSVDKVNDGTRQASHNLKDNFWCKTDGDVKSSAMRKDKEHVFFGVGDSWSISKEREGSQESAESSCSKMPLSSSKRASSPDSIIFGDNREFKKQRNENSCSGPSSTRQSSFMNWISSITNGYITSDQAKPLSSVPQPTPISERKLGSLTKSHEDVGFKSIFQSLYCLSSRAQNNSMCRDLTLQREDDASKVNNVEHECTRPIRSKRISNELSSQFIHDRSSLDQHNQVATSSERLNESTCHVVGLLSTTINVSPAASGLHERTKYSNGQAENIQNTSVIGPPSSSPELVSSDIVAYRSFLESSWVTRLSSMVSSKGEKYKGLTSDRLTNTSNILDQHGVSSSRGQSNIYALKRRIDDQKLKSSLINPIAPSQRFRGPVQIASVFAKRLEALKNIEPVEVPQNASPITTSKRMHETNNAKDKYPESGNAGDTTKLPVNPNVSTSADNVVTLTANKWCLNRVEGDAGESAVGLNMAYDFMDDKLKGSKISPFCSSVPSKISRFCSSVPSSVPTELADETVRAFETIKRLRMSRTDIIRWMKSPIPHSNIEGYFLRLRLGKCEKDFGGTGYHAVCINGANGECKLSVCIGGFTHLVDFHSVSNHDFLEDELKAWWSETLNVGRKRPSIEELNKKLGERMKLGF